METKETSIIIPHLNGNLKILKRTIDTIKRYFSNLGSPYEIIIVDGGSKLKRLYEIRKILTKSPNLFAILDYPLIFPNKNIGILNGANLAKYEDVLILDCDNEKLSFRDLRYLKRELSWYSIVFPNLNRKGGRSNRLLGTPFLRLFFPEIYKKIPYPFPGILGIKKEALLKIVSDKNYCFDWGGEINLAIDGYFHSGGKVSAIKMNKVDNKRVLSSMINDAYQIYRNNIYLSIVYKKFPRNIFEINRLLKLSMLNHKSDVSLLNEFIRKNNLVELEGIETNSDFFNSSNPLEVYEKLDTLYKKYNIYELYLINALVTVPLLKILFDVNKKINIIERPSDTIKNLDLKRISFLADVVIASLLKIFFYHKHTVPYSNLSQMLAKTYFNGASEFNDIKLKNVDNLLACGINLRLGNNKEISKMKNIINNKKLELRNKLLKKFYLNLLIGKIGNEDISFNMINIRSENIKINYDFFVKLSILTTLAGYLKENLVLLNEKEFKKIKLERFLSYVLNNKDFAPINFNLDINFTNSQMSIPKKIEHNYDCVILFSGGFDSTAAFLKARDNGLKPLLLWIGFGQKNEKAEYKMVKQISKKIKYPLSIIRLNLKEYINQGWREWDYIIPARNFIFLCLAASFLSNSRKDNLKIYLSAHEEEIKRANTDKSRQFFNGCKQLFSEFYKKNFIIGTPFEKYSKTEIAAYWKKSWLNKYSISPYDTISCYYGTNCGRCKSCLKRNIALLSGGFKIDPDLKENPFEDKDKFISNDLLVRFNKFPLKRKLELLMALEEMQDKLPIKLKNNMLLLKRKYLKRINSYKKHLYEIKIK